MIERLGDTQILHVLDEASACRARRGPDFFVLLQHQVARAILPRRRQGREFLFENPSRVLNVFQRAGAIPSAGRGDDFLERAIQ